MARSVGADAVPGIGTRREDAERLDEAMRDIGGLVESRAAARRAIAARPPEVAAG
jgi:hypothetical protein